MLHRARAVSVCAVAAVACSGSSGARVQPTPTPSLAFSISQACQSVDLRYFEKVFGELPGLESPQPPARHQGEAIPCVLDVGVPGDAYSVFLMQHCGTGCTESFDSVTTARVAKGSLTRVSADELVSRTFGETLLRDDRGWVDVVLSPEFAEHADKSIDPLAASRVFAEDVLRKG